VLRLALLLALAVPAQAVVGGITVLTGLDPWVVALHMLVSLAMIGVAVVLLRRLHEGDGPAVRTVPSATAWLVRAVFAAGWVVLYVGTVVTGSGPHAGAANVPRNGMDPRALSQLHTDFVFLLLGLTIGALLALRSGGAPARAQRAARTLLGVECAQAAVGFVQYFTGLPVVLVSLHLLGAALLSAAMTWLLMGIRDRTPAAPDQSRSSVAKAATGRGSRPPVPKS
jgi:cytochrome c oxidase assembly protein subunit 15